MENSYVRSENSFISRTMLTMALGLLITFIVAITTPFVVQITMPMLIIAFLAEIGVVIYLTRRIEKLSVGTARAWFLAYSVLNGFTLSIVLYGYGFADSLMAFLFAALMFFSSAMIGITAKRDLSTMARVLYMGVIGLIIASVFQMFLPMQGLNFGISLLGVLIFCGLTAYHMQSIKQFHSNSYGLDSQTVGRFVIISALSLYLDFINIFLYLLRLFKDR